MNILQALNQPPNRMYFYTTEYFHKPLTRLEIFPVTAPDYFCGGGDGGLWGGGEEAKI